MNDKPKDKPSYLAAAFKARPFGMPIPPHLFGVAAFGLLGWLVDPALWMVGAGLEGLYLFLLSTNARFKKTVDADALGGGQSWDSRYESLAANLDPDGHAQQNSIERKAREIVAILSRSGAHESQVAQVRQMAWLHLKLLAARASFVQVIGIAEREQRSLDDQERSCEARLRAETDDELKRSLESQLEVIRSRRAAHADADRRRRLVDAELDRLRQQISLVREQALLATDADSVAGSIDAVSASLNEANHWLREQREIFAGLDELVDEPPPPELLRPKPVRDRRGRARESE
jgi:hypothetical protein